MAREASQPSARARARSTRMGWTVREWNPEDPDTFVRITFFLWDWEAQEYATYHIRSGREYSFKRELVEV